MKKVCIRLTKLVIALTIFLVSVSATTFAAWWGTPGYEWARANRLTTLANNSALNNNVSHANFYSVLIKYLQFKNVKVKENVLQNIGESNNFNGALNGMAERVDSYTTKASLTPTEYREVETYITHVRKMLSDYSQYLTRDDIKSFDLYLSLARYKAATLIDEYSYKVYVLNNMGPVKYKEIIDYNIRPYYANITRKEFLLLMYSLLSDTGNTNEESILEQYEESGVLQGFDSEVSDMRLDKELTYAEMFNFMKRFEIFDFNPIEETEDGESDEDDEDDEDQVVTYR